MSASSGAPDVVLRDPAHRVSTRALLRWRIGALLVAAFFAAVIVAVTVCTDVPRMWIAGIVWVLVTPPYVVMMPRLRWRTHRWETTPTAIYTQWGWLGRHREIAPMSRVQTVEFNQGVIDRMLGLASVSVSTAAGDLSIDMLDADRAEQLSAQLTAAAEADRGDAT